MRRFVLFFVLSASPCIASGQTSVSGTLNSNTTWDLAGSPYLLAGSVTVANARTLTIEAGVVVQFPNASWNLIVDGTLLVQGASASRVQFQGLGSAIGASVVLNAASANSVVDYADFVDLGSPSSSFSSGLYVLSSSASVRDCSFQNCGISGLRIPIEVKPTVINATFSGNGSNDALVHPTAPTNFSNVGGVITLSGSSNVITVSQATWPAGTYQLGAGIQVSFGATLHVQAGAELLFPNASWNLSVDGSLNVTGSQGSPVRFRGPGSGSHGASVALLAASSNSLIDQAEFVDLGSPSSSYGAGLYVLSSSATIRDCTFQNCGVSGLRIPIEVKPTVINATFSGNGSNDALVHPTAPTHFSNVGGVITLSGSSNVITVAQATWPAGVYQLGAGIAVSLGSTLDVKPAAEVTFPNASWNLSVNGSLIVSGTEESPVQFRGPGSGVFGASVALLSSRANCSIDYARFSHLGSASSAYGAGLYVLSSSASITNCEFEDCQSSGIRIPTEVIPIVQHVKFSANGSHDALVHPSAPTRFLDVGGTITLSGSSNTIQLPNAKWPRANYQLGAGITVASSAGLAIDAGANIIFPNASWNLTVDGTLTVAGANDEPVRFAGPGAGSHGASVVLSNSAQPFVCVHAEFERMGSASSAYGAALHVATNSGVFIDGCEFVDAQVDGVRVTAANPNVNVAKSNFESFGQFAIRNSSAGVVTAANNWWSSPTGPTHPTNPGGLGASISGAAAFSPWLSLANRFVLTPNTTVAPPGTTLTLTTTNGCSGCAVGLFLVSVNDEPSTIVPPIVLGSFGSSNDWTFSSVVPPGLVGITAEFRSYGLDICNDLAGTPIISIQS